MQKITGDSMTLPTVQETRIFLVRRGETKARSGCRSKVLVEMTPCQTYSTLRPEEVIPMGTRWARKKR